MDSSTDSAGATSAGARGATSSRDWHNGSFWFDSLPDLSLPDLAAPVATDLPSSVDVAIIGGGYTGLWTAYYLKRADPSLDIAVFEASTIGYGASGRNGGWCMGWANGLDTLLTRNPASGLAFARALQDTVDEIGRVCQAENIDAHYAKGGTLTVARTGAKAAAFRQRVAHLHTLGFDETDYTWLDANEARQRIGMAGNHGAINTPHCAAVHPARLVRGLGDAVRKLGVRICEATPVTGIDPGAIMTDGGAVQAGWTLRATEGYTASLPGLERTVIPVYSMMVATEPLPEAAWNEIGLRERETFGDSRRVVIYGQRTLDNRLAFGGRGSYDFGSGRRAVIDPSDPEIDRVESTLRSLFPTLSGYDITHRWGGVLGVPRHWRPTVNIDRTTRCGWAGGYVGEGVAASNLAARTLTDLVLERDTDLTRLPWVGGEARRWEPEPLRWLGSRAMMWAGARADAAELAGKPPPALATKMFDWFSKPF